MPRVMILGGKGFVGSALVAEARARGYDTLCVDKDEYEGAIGERVDLLINANGNSKKFLAAQDPRLEFDLSVRSVLRSLHDFSAAHYVHLSTIDVYPDASDPARNAETSPIDPARLSPYGFHKFTAEQLVRFYAPRWTLFRMAGFVGPGLWKNSIHDMLAGCPLRVHPDSVYQYLHKRDLAAIVFDVIEGRDLAGEVFNIAGDGVIALRDVAEWIGYDLSLVPPDAPRETYEVSIAKLRALHPIPETVETVRRFVDDIRSGKETLA